jgi:glutamine cyclotransferase
MYATDAELTNLGGWDLPTTFGWGLTLLPALTAAVAEDVLLLSDGTSAIYFLDPCSLTERTELRLTVTHDGSPVTNLNELEVRELAGNYKDE